MESAESGRAPIPLGSHLPPPPPLPQAGTGPHLQAAVQVSQCLCQVQRHLAAAARRKEGTEQSLGGAMRGRREENASARPSATWRPLQREGTDVWSKNLSGRAEGGGLAR